MYKVLKAELLTACRNLLKSNLVIGSQGNLSLRIRSRGNRSVVAITPTSIPYEKMKILDMLIVDMKGNILEGNFRPSSELPLHLAIYRKRADVNAIVHFHSLFTSILSVSHINIPLIMEEQSEYLGKSVNVAEYAASGTKKLALNVVKALNENNAVIMSNHGALVVGTSMAQTIFNAYLLERIAQIFVFSSLVGRIHYLDKKL